MDWNIANKTEFQIHQYLFTRYLGSGSTGTVYECLNMITDVKYACKVMKITDCYDDSFFNHFRDEILIHSQLVHPCIAQIRDLIIDDNYMYFILDLCENGDLNEYVQENQGLSEEEAKVIFYQIMTALSYLHNNNIAHRDIKLENILISSDGKIKLADFGLSKKKIDKMVTVCGTLVYAPPEILSGYPYDGIKADIWSAGILLYAMIACHFPWEADENLSNEEIIKETVEQIKEGRVNPLETDDFNLLDLMASMLNIDPESRPSSLV